MVRASEAGTEGVSAGLLLTDAFQRHQAGRERGRPGHARVLEGTLAAEEGHANAWETELERKGGPETGVV
jgi:hypothetical protein